MRIWCDHWCAHRVWNGFAIASAGGCSSGCVLGSALGHVHSSQQTARWSASLVAQPIIFLLNETAAQCAPSVSNGWRTNPLQKAYYRVSEDDEFYCIKCLITHQRLYCNSIEVVSFQEQLFLFLSQSILIIEREVRLLLVFSLLEKVKWLNCHFLKMCTSSK